MSRFRRPRQLSILVLAAILPLVATASDTPTPSAASTAEAELAASQPEQAEQVERGRYLTAIASCNDCHTPWHMTERGPEPDMSRMLSGHPQEVEVSTPPAFDAAGSWVAAISQTNTAWAGPWGVSFTANLTPDAETGLGSWTEDEFIGAIRSGRHRGRGRPILPPMPWPFISQASDEDLAAIFAFLQSIPAISNRVPDPIPPAVAH